MKELDESKSICLQTVLEPWQLLEFKVFNLIDEFYSGVNTDKLQLFKEQIRNIRKSGSLFKIHHKVIGWFSVTNIGTTHINYWYGLDFLNIHFHPSLDEQGSSLNYMEKPSLFNKYKIVEFDITSLKGIKNSRPHYQSPDARINPNESKAIKDLNGYRYWIDLNEARKILNDFKGEIYGELSIRLSRSLELDNVYYIDGAHRIEGYSTEELNNKLWEASGLSKPFKEDDKDLNSPSSQASCSYSVSDTSNTSSYDEASGIFLKNNSSYTLNEPINTAPTQPNREIRADAFGIASKLAQTAGPMVVEHASSVSNTAVEILNKAAESERYLEAIPFGKISDKLGSVLTGSQSLGEKIVENTSKASSMVSYAGIAGSVGKALPLVGAGIGIYTDYRRDGRIATLESNVDTFKGNQEIITSNLRELGSDVLKVYQYLEHKQLVEEREKEASRKDIEELQERFVTQDSINAEVRKVLHDELSVEMEEVYQKPMKEWLAERAELQREIDEEVREHGRILKEKFRKIDEETEKKKQEIHDYYERDRQETQRRRNEDTFGTPEWRNRLKNDFSWLFGWFGNLHWYFKIFLVGSGLFFSLPVLDAVYKISYLLLLKPTWLYFSWSYDRISELWLSFETKLNPPETVVSSIIKPFASIYDRLILTKNFVEHRIIKVRTIIRLVKYSLILF